MSDNEIDKTRIQSNRNTPSADKTRIAPRTSESKPAVDKTRIAPTAKTEAHVDKTRIAPGAANDNDKTRIAPGKKIPPPGDDAPALNPASPGPDKTRFAPPKAEQPKADTTGSNGRVSAYEALDKSDHRILKKRFVLEDVLGTGGMGIVYKAKDLLKVEAQDRDPYVAIKVLNEEFKTHPEAFISLQRESRKSQRIAHPNIVNVYDFDRDDDTVFMTMEFLDGDPLDELIRRYQSTGLPTDEAWQVIRGMADALIHAHAQKIIHSDFKPGNVFVTKQGLAKVFDFGIARAVAQVEHLEDAPRDQTLFDAGNLGALTPAYASLEMLEGDEPDVRDDIYALGCVAYEMLTGEHPYQKVPADEAQRQGLKPKRINHIKRAQWRAIEKAIAFKRDERMATVSEFKAALSPKLKSKSWLVSGAAVVFAMAVTTYFLLTPSGPEFSEFDIRNELELKIRIDLTKESIELLLQDADFSDQWQDSIWKDISDLSILTKGEDIWVDDKKLVIYQLYLKTIQDEMSRKRYTSAKALIENAGRYTGDDDELAALSGKIATERKKLQQRQAELDKQRKKKEKQLLAQQQANKQAATQQQAAKKEVKAQFDVALENVNNQLKCQANLNMRNFETAIKKLKELNQKKYQALEKQIVGSLAACIVQIGKAFPERAEAAKKHALRLFKSSSLASISIKSRDPCDLSLAGRGGSGKRAICKDKLSNKQTGPDMVVIPGNSKLTAFAIGKYEVSVAELNRYCKASKACQSSKQNSQFPVANISVKQANAYLKWLSRQTGQKYRLPNKDEWLHAAKSRRKSLDPNRNCQLSTRGFSKGEEVVKFSLGKQNSWGLINYVGNVQEWVYDTGRKLTAVGGSFRQAMEDCTITTSILHDGSADDMTGFRVLREIKG